MKTSTLPAAILNENRSNTPFLSRLFLMSATAVLFGMNPSFLWGAAFLMSVGFFVMWAAVEMKKNTALLNSLTQAELISLLGRDHETWRSTDSVVRVLNKRFPNWRD